MCCTGERGAERRGGINESVTTEVSNVFKGKTVSYMNTCTCIRLYIYSQKEKIELPWVGLNPRPAF